MFGIRVTQSILSETKGHQGCPGGGGLAAGTGGGRGGKARPPRPHCRACATHASAGGLPRGPAARHKGRPTVRLPSARRAAGQAASPRAAAAGAAGRAATSSLRAGVGRRPGDGVATGSGIGDVLRRAAAWRRAAASASRRRAAAAASAPAAASARAISPLARVAPRRRPGAQLVLCRPLFTSLGSRPTVCPATLRSCAARPCRRGSPWARRRASSDGRAGARVRRHDGDGRRRRRSLRFGSSALSAARARDAALSSRGAAPRDAREDGGRVHQGRRPLVALALDHLRRRVLGGQRLRGAPEHRGRLPHQRVDAVFLHRYRFYGVRRLLGAAAAAAAGLADGRGYRVDARARRRLDLHGSGGFACRLPLVRVVSAAPQSLRARSARSGDHAAAFSRPSSGHGVSTRGLRTAKIYRVLCLGPVVVKLPF